MKRRAAIVKSPLDEVFVVIVMEVILFQSLDDYLSGLDFDAEPMTSFSFTDSEGCPTPPERVEHRVSNVSAHLHDSVQEFRRQSVRLALSPFTLPVPPTSYVIPD